MSPIVFYCAVGSGLFFTLLWAIQLKTKNATSVDVAWSFGIAVVSSIFAVQSEGNATRRAVLAGLTFIWAFRLGGHLFFDRVIGQKPEDGRYAKLRKEWSSAKFYLLYLIQSALTILLPLTLLGAFQNPDTFGKPLDFLAIGFWMFAISGEALADHQLAKFKKNPLNRGKTCKSGLWHYSRHPNYFFEWLIWCAYLPLAWGSPLFWVSFSGPALLLLLLTKISGIPPTEAQAVESRGEEYREYQRTTNAFIPGRPKNA